MESKDSKKENLVTKLNEKLSGMDIFTLKKVEEFIDELNFIPSTTTKSIGVNKFTGEERRAYKRIYTSLPVAYTIYTIIGPDLEPRMTKSKDIGGGGTRLVLFTEEKVWPGFLLELEIYLPDRTEPILTQGRVVWVKDYHEGSKKGYEAGIEFVDIVREERSEIANFVNREDTRNEVVNS